MVAHEDPVFTYSPEHTDLHLHIAHFFLKKIEGPICWCCQSKIHIETSSKVRDTVSMGISPLSG